MTRRLVALALLALLAAPSWAATYWVGPRGTFQNSGVDSSGNEKSLAWANAYATDDDVIRLKPGYYPATDIAPRAKTTSSTRLRFIGDLTNLVPGNYVVSNVTLDSATTNGGTYITVYGVEAEGKLSIAFRGAASRGSHNNATAANDSVVYCKFRRGGSLSTVSNVTLAHNTFGEGRDTDKFAVGYVGNVWAWHDDPCHCPTPTPGCVAACGSLYTLYLAHRALPDNSADSAAWSNNLTITDNTFNLATSGNANAMQFYWMKSSTFARNRSTITAMTTAGDTHFNTWYDTQDCDINDNYWYCDDQSATLNYPSHYGLNARDNQVANRWVRDTVIEASASLKPVKAMFLTSGAHDSTSHNNLWDSNYIRVRGMMGYQARADGETHKFNTYIYGREGSTEAMSLAVSNSFGTDWCDSMVFRHNTVVSFGASAIVMDGSANKLVNATIKSNIFMARRDLSHPPFGCLPQGFAMLAYRTTFTGTVDSNLVWSSAGVSDSSMSVDLGGCSRSGVHWSTTRDRNSQFRCPAYTDTTWDTFSHAVATTSPAYGSQWADNYVGSYSPTVADVGSPVVTMTSPLSTTTYPAFGTMDISWSATDDVGVSSVTLSYSTDGVTYTTIVSGQAASGTYVWQYPSIHYTAVYVKVTATDAAGNAGSTVVRTGMACQPCYDTEPGSDPNRIEP